MESLEYDDLFGDDEEETTENAPSVDKKNKAEEITKSTSRNESKPKPVQANPIEINHSDNESVISDVSSSSSSSSSDDEEDENDEIEFIVSDSTGEALVGDSSFFSDNGNMNDADPGVNNALNSITGGTTSGNIVVGQDGMGAVDENDQESLNKDPFARALDSAPKMNTKVFEIDLDTLDEKPWDKPGANMSDYFNYGFTDKTWPAFAKQMQKKVKKMRYQSTESYTNNQQKIKEIVLSHSSLTPLTSIPSVPSSVINSTLSTGNTNTPTAASIPTSQPHHSSASYPPGYSSTPDDQSRHHHSQPAHYPHDQQQQHHQPYRQQSYQHSYPPPPGYGSKRIYSQMEDHSHPQQ